MLTFIKFLHTVVWVVMVSAIFYAIYAGFMGYTDWRLWTCLVMIGLEALVLLVNGWVCPLTTFAARHTRDRSPNFDIFLPNWLAKHNKTIFTVIILLSGIGIAIRWTIFS